MLEDLITKTICEMDFNKILTNYILSTVRDVDAETHTQTHDDVDK